MDMIMKVNYFQWICAFIFLATLIRVQRDGYDYEVKLLPLDMCIHFLTTLIGYGGMDMVMKVNYFQWICTFVFLTTLIRVQRDGYGYEVELLPVDK